MDLCQPSPHAPHVPDILATPLDDIPEPGVGDSAHDTDRERTERPEHAGPPDAGQTFSSQLARVNARSRGEVL